MEETTIINSIYPNCEQLYINLKRKKEQMHLTNQNIADKTGVPLSNIKKFFAGDIVNPNIFNVMAICMCLGESLDDLLGNSRSEASLKAEYAVRTATLEAENKDLRKDIEHLKEMNSLQSKTIDHLEAAYDRRGKKVGTMILTSILLVLTVLAYLTVDYKNLSVGLFQEEFTSPMVFLVIGIVIIAIVLSLKYAVLLRKNRTTK